MLSSTNVQRLIWGISLLSAGPREGCFSFMLIFSSQHSWLKCESPHSSISPPFSSVHILPIVRLLTKPIIVFGIYDNLGTRNNKLPLGMNISKINHKNTHGKMHVVSRCSGFSGTQTISFLPACLSGWGLTHHYYNRKAVREQCGGWKLKFM